MSSARTMYPALRFFPVPSAIALRPINSRRARSMASAPPRMIQKASRSPAVCVCGRPWMAQSSLPAQDPRRALPSGRSQISGVRFSASCHLSLPRPSRRPRGPVRGHGPDWERLALRSVLCDRQAGLWPGSSSRPTAVLRRLDWGSFEDHASGLGLVKSGEPSDVHLAVSRGGCQGRSPTLKPCGAQYVRPRGVAWGGWEIQARVLVGAAAATLWSRVLRSPLRVGGWVGRERGARGCTRRCPLQTAG